MLPVALDLGTTKYCIASINNIKDKKKVEVVSVKSYGMKKGMLSDFSQAQASLTSLLDIAEKDFNKCIRKTVVGIAGSHLSSSIIEITSEIPSGLSIDSQFLTLNEEKTLNKNLSHGKEIIHVIPVSYKIDAREWIDNPRFFSGQSLTTKYFIIEADRHYLNDIIKLCNACGLEVSRVIAEPLASSYVVSNNDQKARGSAVADIGGGTTDGIIFKNSKPLKLFNINIGGDLISNDLSIGLGISKDDAERIKMEIGLTSGFKNHEMSASKTTHILKILKPRIEELCSFIRHEIQLTKSNLDGGLILTGGGSEIKGLLEVASKSFPFHVGIDLPDFPKEAHLETNRNLSGKFSTVLGLLYLDQLATQSPVLSSQNSVFHRYFHSFSTWLKELS